MNRDRSSARLNRESESPESDQIGSDQTTSTAVGTTAPLNAPVQYMDTVDRNPAFHVNYQIGVQDQMRSSQPFSTPGIKTDYSELDSQPIAGSRTSASVTPGEQPGLDYLTHTTFGSSQSSAPEHTVHHAPYPAPLSNPHQTNGQFNAWPSQFQSNAFSSVDYTGQTMSHQQSLSQQVQMLPTAGLPQPHHPGHHLNSRSQSQFDPMSLSNGSPQFRNGSISHPHMEPRNGGTDHPMN